MALSLPEIVQRYTLDYAGFAKGAAGIGASAASGGTALQKFGNLGRDAMLGISAAALVGGVASVKLAGDFQQSMTQLVTGAGESEKNIKMVSRAILDMAPAMGTTALELSKGMYMIESAGYHGADGLKILKVAAEGAKVGNADFMVTANAVTTVMKDYHLKTSDAATATNFLVSVVSQGKVHMQDLASSMATILPIASALNVPLADVGGAMATMTSHGIAADKAATFLRFTLGALVNPTAAATKALKDVGLGAHDLGETLTHQGLVAALQQLQDHLTTKFAPGSAEFIANLAKMTGGTRGMQAALALTGQNLQEFIAHTNSTASAITNAHGKVIGWARVQGDLNFQLDQAAATAQTLAIKIGNFLIPKLEAVGMAIADVISWFEKNKSAAIALASVIGGVLVAAMVTFTALKIEAFAMKVAAGFRVMSTAATLLSASFTGLGASEVAATWPILALVAAVAASAAAWYELITHWNEVKHAFETSPVFATIRFQIEMVTLNVRILGAVFGAVFPVIASVVRTLGSAIAAVFGPTIRFQIEMVTVAVRALGAVFNAVFPVISTVVQAAGSVIGTVFSAAQVVFTGVTAVVRGLGAAFSAVFPIISGVVQAAGSVIGAVFALLSAQMSVVGAAVTKVADVFGVAWGIVSSVVQAAGSVVSAILGALDSALGGTGNAASSLAGVFQGAMHIVADVANFAAGVVSGAMGVIEGAANFAAGVVSGAMNAMHGAFQVAADAANVVAGIIEGAMSAIESAINTAAAAANALARAIKSIPSSLPGGSIFGVVGGVLGLQTGGLIPGVPGTPVPILGHAGEVVVNPYEPAVGMAELMKTDVFADLVGGGLFIPPGLPSSGAGGGVTVSVGDVTVQITGPVTPENAQAIGAGIGAGIPIGVAKAAVRVDTRAI